MKVFRPQICALPKLDLCTFGCYFREHKHLACSVKQQLRAPCVAPCVKCDPERWTCEDLKKNFDGALGKSRGPLSKGEACHGTRELHLM
jgi:hypothetical protein